MVRLINPLVDIVFKTLLGSEQNKILLLDFLHCVLKPAVPIADIQILNPFSTVEQAGDKLTVVDIKARDQQGQVFQIEVQLQLHDAITERMLYTWCGQYGKQISEGNKYRLLRPVTAIWVIDQRLFQDEPYHHWFQVMDPAHRLTLSRHLSIHTLELPKWKLGPGKLDGIGRWLYFLKEGKFWEGLPSQLQNDPIMEQAMETVQRFSLEEQEYWRYMARLDAWRVQQAIQDELEELKEARQKLLTDVDQLKAERDEVEAQKLQAEAEKRHVEAEMLRVEAEMLRVEAERERAQAELLQAEGRRQHADAERQHAEAERRQAEAERQHAEAERLRAESEIVRVEAEKVQVQTEMAAAEADRQRLRQRLLAAGIDPDL